MLVHFAAASNLVIAMLVGCFVLVLAFEATNGFHDTANAVATVIYTHALKPVPAVLWSGLLNFVGVMVGGISVAYALVEILPPDVLTPPDGSPAVPMLVSLFATALFWNVLTWAFGIPNSSSHCIIGALIGVAASDALLQNRGLGPGVDWHQIIKVLEALAISPVLGFVGAGGLYLILRLVVARGSHLLEPPEDDKPPAWWLRGLLILTCTSVSFSHGTNDGQKSIGLIMLTIIGLMPAQFALNPQVPDALTALSRNAAEAIPLIQKYGDDQKDRALQAAEALQKAGPAAADQAKPPPDDGRQAEARATRSQLRGNVYFVLSEMKHVGESDADPQTKAAAARLGQAMGPPVQYAPTWVRMLSALCLGAGTMVGYKRVVRTLGERLGKAHMTPGQGGSAELVGSLLIGTAGFTGLPVSTTHIITSGIAGTMVAGGQGVQRSMLVRIGLAWVFTLPVTMLLAGGLFYLLDNPRF
jgi:PiT family inorganic phosphate transporter